jgi:DNA-binding response OmpR family regulator
MDREPGLLRKFPMRILLIEDDTLLPSAMREALRRAGYEMDHLDAAEPALNALGLVHYDLAIIDIGLPVMDGITLVKRLREAGHHIPVLMLTARDGLDDRVRALTDGADDYLIKPFELPELLARIQALIRRSQSASASPVMVVGPLTLDMSLREATLAGEPMPLTGREWDVLLTLMLAAPKVVTKARLTDSLSQWDRSVTGNAVEIYVSRLRGKLGGHAVSIRTVRGIGYRLEMTTADDETR